MLSLVLAFGFIISCTGTKPLLPDYANDLESEELFASGSTLISENPESPVGYYYTGLAHSRKARTLSPSERMDDYMYMVNYFDQALELMGRSNPADAELIHNQLRSAWSNEHNSAATLFGDDSITTSDEIQSARVHALNARTIIPDSVITAELLADIYIRLRQPDLALVTLEDIRQRQPQKAGFLVERMAVLAAFQGNLDQSAYYYIEAIDWHTRVNGENLSSLTVPVERGSLLNTYHGAINVFIDAGMTDEAISSLIALHDAFPEADIYRQLLVNQYFSKLQNDAFDEMSLSNISDASDVSRIVGEIDALVSGRPELVMDAGFELLSVAERYIGSMTEFDPDFKADSDATVAVLLRQTRFYLVSVLRNQPDLDDVRDALAESWYLIGNDEEAEKILSEINE